MTLLIKKANGEIEEFDESKLLDSLIRSGADRAQAEDIVSEVVPQIKPYTSTRKIFRLAHKYLKKYNRASVLRYSLKESLLRLGPTGYPFEKYVGKLLDAYGYRTSVGIIMQGKCVTHEVDVFAEKGEEIIFAECKYRNNANGAPDVKTAMYVHSRFQDLRSAVERQYAGRELTGWLVTNTRFTHDAVRYAECVGLELRSWRYPVKESLEKMIEKKKLYPVTVMTGLNSSQIRELIGRDVILMKDLAGMKVSAIGKLLSVTERTAAKLKKQAEELCFC